MPGHKGAHHGLSRIPTTYCRTPSTEPPISPRSVKVRSQQRPDLSPLVIGLVFRGGITGNTGGVTRQLVWPEQ